MMAAMRPGRSTVLWAATGILKHSLVMPATVMFRLETFRIENVPWAKLIEPTDAIVCVTRACICGSDPWPYQKMERTERGRRFALMSNESH